MSVAAILTCYNTACCSCGAASIFFSAFHVPVPHRLAAPLCLFAQSL